MNGSRVLLVSSNSSGRGGGERYLVFLAEGLRQLGVDVHVLISTLSYMDGWAEDLTRAGAVVHRHPLVALAQRPLRFVQAMLDGRQIKAIAKLCEAIAPDAILVNQQYDEDGLDYLAGALRSGCRSVSAVMHMPMTADKHRRPLGRWRGWLLSRWYARHAFRLILVSQGARAEFEAYYGAPRPTFVVNNAAPLPDAPAAGEGLPARSSDEPVIGFVGQFVAQKNLFDLLRAWVGLRQAGTPCKLLLVGDGPLRPELEAWLQQAAPDGGWTITGWTPQPEAMLSRIDVFVLCSHFEGLPLSLVEAAARGISCVVTPFNGAADVAQKAHWVHVTGQHSPTQLQDLLQRVLANRPMARIDDQALAAFRAYFSIQRMAQEVAEVMGVRTCMS